MLTLSLNHRLKKLIKTKFTKRFRKASSDASPMESSGSSEAAPAANSESAHLLKPPALPPPSYEHALSESRFGEKSKAVEDEPEQQKELLIFHKSSKELYKALAAQWGITCKMNDHCRCYDCQSHYFDCECDNDNENQKTDGGLGAGAPMFINEVMHGTACTIL